MGDSYIRHDEMGHRTVGRDEYAAELRAMKEARPDVRILVYDHLLASGSAWFRVTMRWTDRTNGKVCTRAALQSYRIEGGKLAETWVLFQPLGSAWADPVAQETWTSRPPLELGS